MLATPWQALMTGNGCVANDVTFETLNGASDPGTGTPPSIETLAVSIVVHCNSGGVPPLIGNSPSTATVASASVPVGQACGSINGPGTACGPPYYNWGNVCAAI